MLRVDLRTIPESPGVYQFMDENGSVLYVGKAADLRARLSQYRPGQVEPRIERLLEKAVNVEVILTGTETEALLLESNLIKRYRPRFNVRLTDDKRYPYLHLSPGPWPRVAVVRDANLPGTLYGPFPHGAAAWATLKSIREAFRIRDCKELIPGGCLNYQMRLCWGPCLPDLDERRRKTPDRALSDANVDTQYAASVREAEAFLRGDAETLTSRLARDMDEASEGMEFERAALARDRLQAITTTLEKQAIFAGGREDRDAFAVHREGPDASGVVVLLRGGAIAGQETFTFRGAAAATEGELLDEFVRRYYEHMPTVPREILVAVPLAGTEAVEAWLATKRGGPVDVRVPQRGDLVRIVEHARRNAEYRLHQSRLKRGEAEGERELDALRDALGLDEAPQRIECFDVSHLAGTEVVASMSVLVSGQPARGEYRRFKLREDRNDDYASMEEVVHRRYARLVKDGAPLPGLVLIDGGRGQLQAARRALEDLGLGALPIAALAKREEEVFVPGLLRPLPLAKDDEALRPLLRARDEAHRFAVAYQRQRRKQRLTESALDAVPGLGPVRRRRLLAHFGTVDAVIAAREEDIAKVPGIGPALARALAAELRR